MGFHTFDADMADRLEDATRFRFCSREELLEPLPRGDDATVVDLGSGTGFYTDEIAPYVGRVLALDVQQEMHGVYQEKGLPANVSQVTADAETIPLAAGSVDGAYSTATFHESTTEASLTELHRVLADGAPLVVVDWSQDGAAESGPPVEERFSAQQARELLEAASFTIESAVERSETFRIVAHA